MEKTVELLHETSKRLAQTIDMIDILSLACSSVEKADLIGPLEIMKRGIRWASMSKYAEKEKWISPVY